jgi:hypothetical protein
VEANPDEELMIPVRRHFSSHVVGRNASTTKPARFVVFLVKNKAAPLLVPVK